jgi:hypothetical protein
MLGSGVCRFCLLYVDVLVMCTWCVFFVFFSSRVSTGVYRRLRIAGLDDMEK